MKEKKTSLSLHSNVVQKHFGLPQRQIVLWQVSVRNYKS